MGQPRVLARLRSYGATDALRAWVDQVVEVQRDAVLWLVPVGRAGVLLCAQGGVEDGPLANVDGAVLLGRFRQVRTRGEERMWTARVRTGFRLSPGLTLYLERADGPMLRLRAYVPLTDVQVAPVVQRVARAATAPAVEVDSSSSRPLPATAPVSSGLPTLPLRATWRRAALAGGVTAVAAALAPFAVSVGLPGWGLLALAGVCVWFVSVLCVVSSLPRLVGVVTFFGSYVAACLLGAWAVLTPEVGATLRDAPGGWTLPLPSAVILSVAFFAAGACAPRWGAWLAAAVAVVGAWWVLSVFAGASWLLWWWTPHVLVSGASLRALAWAFGMHGAFALAFAAACALWASLSVARERSIGVYSWGFPLVLAATAWLGTVFVEGAHRAAVPVAIELARVVDPDDVDALVVALDTRDAGTDAPSHWRVAPEGRWSLEALQGVAPLGRAWTHSAVRVDDAASFGVRFTPEQGWRARAKRAPVPILESWRSPEGLTSGVGRWTDADAPQLVVCSEAALPGAHGAGALVAHVGSLGAFAPRARPWMAAVDLAHTRLRSAESATLAVRAVHGGVSGVVGPRGRLVFHAPGSVPARFGLSFVPEWVPVRTPYERARRETFAPLVGLAPAAF